MARPRWVACRRQAGPVRGQCGASAEPEEGGAAQTGLGKFTFGPVAPCRAASRLRSRDKPREDAKMAAGSECCPPPPLPIPVRRVPRRIPGRAAIGRPDLPCSAVLCRDRGGASSHRTCPPPGVLFMEKLYGGPRCEHRHSPHRLGLAQHGTAWPRLQGVAVAHQPASRGGSIPSGAKRVHSQPFSFFKIKIM